MNHNFINAAFTKKEQKAIAITKVDNSAIQGYNGWKKTSGGKNTQDRIFLLSYAEANSYLGVTHDDTNNAGARVSPTKYALAQGAWIDHRNSKASSLPVGWWWLRSPGYDQRDAAVVFADGSLSLNNVSNDSGIIRPALWLNLKSDIF